MWLQGKKSKALLPSLVIAAMVASCATPMNSPSPGPVGSGSTTPAVGTLPEGQTSQAPVTSQNARNSVFTPPETDLDTRDYEQIHKLYLAQSYEAAIAKAREFEATHPGSSLLSPTENLLGLSMLMLRNPTGAIEHFQNAIRINTRNPSVNSYLRYNLAKAQYEANQLEEANQTLQQADFSTLDPENAIKFRILRSNIDTKLRHGLDAAREILAASRLLAGLPASPKTEETRKNLETYLDQDLQAITVSSQLEELYRENGDSIFARLILLRLGQKELAQGESGKAETHLNQLIALDPGSPYARQARAALQVEENQTVVDTRTIGVLLPVKGKFAAFGIHNLQAIELAFNIFNNRVPDPGYSIVIEDSGEEPSTAINALDRLVRKDHVAAVIGPLLSKGADQVTQHADELGVPLISLSRHAGVTGNYAIQGGLTLQLQAYSMARYAIQALGLQRFAIVAPSDKMGQETTQYFWDAVESLGGQITGSEQYAPDETDFKEVVDKLSGLYYTAARQKELDALAKLRKENKITRRTRKTEQYFALKPIVDYQAVFIADDPKVAAQIIPTFAYRDVDKVRFLGTSAWNSPELVARAQTYAEGALFVDAFYPGSASRRTRRFIESFKSTFGDTPSGMDAMAYDAAQVVRRALRAAGDHFSRAELLDKIKHVEGYHGVTGLISFKDGQLLRDLKVLTIHNGQIAETRDLPATEDARAPSASRGPGG